jgi:serine/threonine-protein kinase RsbW
MNGMRSLNGGASSQPRFSAKRSRSPVLEVDSWMPSKVQAISPAVDRLMGLIERMRCVPGKEFDIELALREALRNAVVHGNEEHPERKVHIRCRCEHGEGISIIVTDQGKGFDFEKVVRNGLASDPGGAHGYGIQLMKAYMDDVCFTRGGTEVRMRKAPTGGAGRDCEPLAK